MFRIFTIIFLSLGVICLATLHSATGSASAKQDSRINAAQEMIAWQQEYVALTSLLTSVFDGENLAFLYDESVFESTESLNVAVESYNEKRNAILSLYNQKKKLLPPPERWDIQKSFFDRTERKLFNAMTEQYNALDEFRNDMALASDFGGLLRNSEINENEEILNEILTRQLDASARVVRAENKQIDAFLTVMQSNNPNYQFHQIMKAGNIAGLYEVEWSKHSLTRPDDLATRKSLGIEMRQSISNVPELIKRARKNLIVKQKDLKKLLRTPSITSQQKTFIEKAVIANKTFEDSLLIEEKLYKNISGTVALMISDKTDAEQEDRSDEIALEFYDLVDSRVEVIQARMQAMAQ